MQRLLFLFILGLSFMPSSFATSFSCSKATSLQDKLICAGPALSAADTQLAAVYKNALSMVSDPAALKKAQEDWLTHRDICTDANCLLQTYQTRIADLQQEITAALPITPRNPDGTYPVWVSPDLGLKSLSRQDIDAALERKFWDVPAYQRDFKKAVTYLKAHQHDEALYQNQLKTVRINNDALYPGNLITVPAKDNVIPATCNQLAIREQQKNLSAFLLFLSEAVDDSLSYSLFLSRTQADCQTVRLLQYVKPAKKSFVHDFVFNKNFTDFLPALMVPDDTSCFSPHGDPGFHKPANLGALPENQKKSWHKFYGFEVDQKNRDVFLVKKLTPIDIKLYVNYTTDAESHLQLLAKGDFNSSGFEQILMSTNINRDFYDGDGGRIGSDLFLLSRKDTKSVLELAYPDKYIDGTCDIRLDELTKNRS